MRTGWRIASAVLLGLAITGGGLAGDRLLAVTDATRDNLKLLTELIDTAKTRYGRDVTYRDLVFSGIQGMLRTLDPHTGFLSPQAHSQMRERQQASFYGLGILVGLRNGRLTVITPIEGTPASRLGIRAGDIIDAIEGEPTKKMSVDDAVSKLKGPKGTEVKISILRVGFDDPLPFTVVRAEIPQTTVRYSYMIEPGTGYISISDFSRSTGAEVERAIEKLRGEGMQRLLLDLRNNGGGLLDQAITVSDQFLAGGSSIVETRGRIRDAEQAFRGDGDHPALGIPLVVLVNSGTASASEIVSGAIQDHDVGLVVGTPTWGKGLVQTVYSLSYGAGLALTTAKYYTPSGRLIQRDYRSFFDYYARTDVEPAGEGENAKAKAPGEEYSTDLGRKVYGGGGITPDFAVEPNEVAQPMQFLLARAAFFRFAIDWANRNPAVGRDWTPQPAMIEELRSWLVREKLETPEEAAKLFVDESERAYALRQIQAEVLSSRFGIEAAHQALSPGDAQIQAALALFPRAASLLAQREGLERAPEIQASESMRQ